MIAVDIPKVVLARIDTFRGELSREDWIKRALTDYMDRLDVAAMSGGYVSERVDDATRARYRSAARDHTLADDEGFDR